MRIPSLDRSPVLPAYIDSTMRSAFSSCEQKFFAEFCLGLRPGALSIDLHAGGCFASALESFYRSFWEKGLDYDHAISQAYGTFLHEWGDFQIIKKTAKTQDNIWAGIISYLHKYPPREDPLQPFIFEEGNTPSVEFSFAIPLPENEGFPLHPVTNEPFLYVGRADMLGRHGNQITVKDDKTAGKLESDWADKWNLRGQFLGYCWALTRSGLKCNKVLVRGTIFTQTEIRHVEAEKLYPDFLIKRWEDQLRLNLKRLVECWKKGEALSDPGKGFGFDFAEACTQYGGCAFRDRCTSSDPNMFNSDYSVSRWDPTKKNPLTVDPIVPPHGLSLAGALRSSASLLSLVKVGDPTLEKTS